MEVFKSLFILFDVGTTLAPSSKLAMLYLDRVVVGERYIPRVPPRVNGWDDKKAKQRLKKETEYRRQRARGGAPLVSGGNLR
ncbi:hypothetical protein CCACVL1_05914 [Corchorus capsularis]|uniref:Uncharacterized protein n=1 Tax=Corchorus capsularis TaxID=210143 RepID=A0A1R3JIC9_COCAP|nr:hypothetical protein CCACVL1_05914 [Corchorus capsularis]